MLWEIRTFGAVGGNSYFDLYADGKPVLERQSYDTCRDFVFEHASDADYYVERDAPPGYDWQPRMVAVVKASLKALGSIK